jgi:septal ring factor EnvC (AmiA/AmiB activator)
MPGRKSNQKWEVRDGKPVVTTPAVEATTQEVPVKRLEREIARTARRREQVEAQLAELQTEVDDLKAHEAEVQAVLDQVSE